MNPSYSVGGKSRLFPIRVGLGAAILGSCLAGILGSMFLENEILDPLRWASAGLSFLSGWYLGYSYSSKQQKEKSEG